MRVCATIAIVLLAAGVSRASLLTYEPFDYAEGQPINGSAAGGSGWAAGGWGLSPGTVATASSPGLSAPGSIPQVGRSMLLSAGTGVSATRLSAVHYNVPATSDYWFSYIQQRNPPPPSPGGQGFLTLDIGHAVFLTSYESGIFLLADNTGGVTTSPTLPASSDPMLIVVHAAPQGLSHCVISVFINPASGPINPIESALFPYSLTAAGADINFSGNLSSDVRIDEFRIGTTFLDVAAVPSPGAPVVVAAFGLLAAGRRRGTIPSGRGLLVR